MQISDKLGQYNRNVTNGTEELRSSQGAQKLVSTVQQLEAGNIFEGTVNSVKNGKVILALGNGQLISARLDGKVPVTQGESMFFQVRSNDGTTVAIRPYSSGENINNPILLNALTAAGIPATERSVMMVDAMMQEQMSIGKQSILDMARVLNNNPNVGVQTMVQMTKLGLPVTEQMAAQFESYVANEHALLGELENAVGELTAVLGDETLSASDAFTLFSQMLGVFEGEAVSGGGQQPQQSGEVPLENIVLNLGGDKEAVSGEMPEQPTGQGTQLPAQPGEIQPGEMQSGQMQPGQIQTGQMQPDEVQSGEIQQAQETGQPPVAVEGDKTADAAQPMTQEAQNAGRGNESAVKIPQTGETLEQVLSESQLADLKKALQNIPTLTGNPAIFEAEGTEEIFVDTLGDEEAGNRLLAMLAEEQAATKDAALNKNMTVSDFLNTLRGALQENSQYGFAGVQKLFSGDAFKELLRNMAEQQWLVKPGELKEANKMNELYSRVENQMKQMETVMKMAGMTSGSFTQAATEVRSNLEFMNQINQLYTYIQIPLKLSGQNASSELYVYTNKKNLKDPEAELTAFLHLDLENLGSTDVSIRMKQKKVKTNFYISDDASYQLIEKHLPILEKRLKKKGYQCSITVANEQKKVDFVENFLEKDLPPTGTLHRYSFDVKA